MQCVEVAEDDFDLDLVIQSNIAAKEALAIEQESATFSPLLTIYLFFLFMFQSLFRLSDHALDVLMKFISIFLKSLAKLSSIPKSFVQSLPTSIYTARKVSGNERDKFERFVVCPECHSLYKLNECIVKTSSGQTESKTCTFVQFPSHPQPQHRKPCGTLLLKKIKSRNGDATSFYPKRVYCYKSLIASLQNMLWQPDFTKKCEEWRKKDQTPGVYSDVYSGNTWKEFMNPGGIPFLSVPNNYALQLNVDWFNPFQHTQHSEGAIYISILNLPRKERFLQENIILVGVIPGPKEPPLLINSYLNPLVNELNDLWKGVILKDHNNHSVLIRAALICASSDIPASRKVCGFVGHNAVKACSKCLLSFTTAAFGEKADYSDFDKTHWTARTNTEHRTNAEKHKMCTTQSAKKKIEREHGVRYTALLKLPYFDPVKMCVVDPMHNLLLGTAKHITELWKSKQILSSSQFDVIQEKVNSMVTPPDIGRLPYKISSGFSGFSADQWKNWVVSYSLFALKDELPWQHYNCWHLFVKVCYLLCRRTISDALLREADDLITEFWELFKKLYGSDACTINIHLHGHLTECIREFGPVYAFWCFAYERMNGVLGSFHTNNHHVSVQYMRRFLDGKVYSPANWPKECAEEYLPLLQSSVYQKGSLMPTSFETELASNGCYIPLPPLQEFALSESQKSELCSFVQSEFSCNGDAFTVLTLCRQTRSLKVGDYALGARSSRHSRSSLVLAYRGEVLELAEIQYFSECAVVLNDQGRTISLWVACVNWYLEHPCKLWYGNPVEVWTTVHSPVTSLIPVKHIKSRLVYAKCRRDFGRRLLNDSVYVISPLNY